MFIFESNDKMVYSSPDSYIWNKKDHRVDWGDELKLHPVFYKGCEVLTGTQDIYVSFSHDGKSGTTLESIWTEKGNKNWYTMISDPKYDIVAASAERIVRFDLGPSHPLYFKSKYDLCWYLGNIYPLDNVTVFDSEDA